MRPLLRLVTALAAVASVGLGAGAVASAHDPGSSAVLIDISNDAVTAEVQLPIDRLGLAVELPLTSVATPLAEYGTELGRYIGDNIVVTGADGAVWGLVVGELSIESVDDVDHVVTTIALSPPGAVSAFTLDYSVILERIVTHKVVVAVGNDGSDRSVVGTIDHAQTSLWIDASAAPGGTRAMVELGFDHVLDGADHLLFLMVLLLPAPLLVGDDRRWSTRGAARTSARRVVFVATAFTIGHSCTLVLSARGWVTAPSDPVEVLVAVSIAAGALHALRPIVRQGEAIIGAVFGLVHGLAFARILDELGLGANSWRALVGFNVGVELAQLLVIAVVFPLIYLVSGTPRAAGARRVTAVISLIAAAGWIVERLDIVANPFAIVERTAMDNLGLIAVLIVAGTVVLLRVQSSSPDTAESREPVSTASGR